MHSDLELGPVLRRSYLFINFLLLRGELDYRRKFEEGFPNGSFPLHISK